MAHASGKRELAHEALKRIGELFQLDNAWKELDPDERRGCRLAELQPRVGGFRQWIEADLPSLPSNSLLAQACGYCAKHWAALTGHLEDGCPPLTHNSAERAMHPIALGRHNCLFAGSVRGGQAAPIALSFIASCKLQQKNPYTYLREVLTRLPSPKARHLDALLPHLWQPS